MRQEDLIDELDEKDIDEEQLSELIGNSVWNDLLQALSESRYSASVVCLLVLLLSYHLAVAPYQTTVSDYQLKTIDDLKTIRPILPNHQMETIGQVLLRAETEVQLPPPNHDDIKFRFFSYESNNNIDSRRLPPLFYEGVMFGITSLNSHEVDFTGDPSRNSLKELHQDLMELHPTAILDRVSRCNLTGWQEEGFAVYFSYRDLATSGRLGNDHRLPANGKWDRVSQDILWIARKHRQISITVWYPNSFGSISDTADVYKYQNVIQQILPTRTGMYPIKSTAVVWLSTINGTEPEKKSTVYSQEWSLDANYLEWKQLVDDNNS